MTHRDFRFHAMPVRTLLYRAWVHGLTAFTVEGVLFQYSHPSIKPCDGYKHYGWRYRDGKRWLQLEESQ